LTAKQVENAKPVPKRRELPDGHGLYLQVQASGHRSWASRYRYNGDSAKLTLGAWPAMSLAAAREANAAVQKQVAAGIDPGAAKKEARAAAQLADADTLRSVCERYLALEEKRGQKRSIGQVRKTIERLVYPRPIAGMPVGQIKKSQFHKLLEDVELGRGARMSDVLKSALKKILDAYAEPRDDFTNPLLGLKRRYNKESRSRILDDDEIRRLWAACNAMPGSFGPAVQLLLLTACRRNEVLQVAWPEINSEGDWTIPASRYKSKRDHLIPLSGAARAIIDSMPRVGAWVFANRDGGRRVSYGDAKARLDRLAGLAPWRLHDLRRTSRSLLSRAGVSPDVAERCLGHAIGGVRGVYDRYEFRVEKAAAFEALAGLIDRIINPADNVTELRDRPRASNIAAEHSWTR
jgi:integrase